MKAPKGEEARLVMMKMSSKGKPLLLISRQQLVANLQ
jgi:hypothetical protein